jgi:hypothetical protein
MQSPTCFRCGKTPDELEEYVDLAIECTEFHDDDYTPDDVVRYEEGTFNSESNRFCCTMCYVAIGCPSGPTGWIAP